MMHGSISQNFLGMKKSNKKWGLVLLLALSLPASLFAQERLAYSIPLFDAGTNTMILNASDNWLKIADIPVDNFLRAPKPAKGSFRKWRVRSEYTQFQTNKKATIEVLLTPTKGKAIVFVMPWQDRSTVAAKNDSSNWFIPYDEHEGVLLDSDSKASLRLITEVGSSASVHVSRVVLEAWDIAIEDTQRAFGPSLPSLGNNSTTLSKHDTEIYRQDALQFSLNFIKYGLNGELPKYYYTQAATVYGLEDGKGYSVYRWAPPQKDYGDVNIDLFVKNYRYRIYDYQEMKEIYPEWFANNRQWAPSINSYLFIGDQVRVGGVDFVSDNILMFVVEYLQGRWQVVARPLKK